jgi:hypothetical protein
MTEKSEIKKAQSVPPIHTDKDKNYSNAKDAILKPDI